MKSLFTSCLLLWIFAHTILQHQSFAQKLGHENTFLFTNEVNVTDLNELTPSLSYKTEGGFNIGVIWRDGDVKLLQFRLNHLKIFTKSQKTQETKERISLDDFSRDPFYAVINKNVITDVYLIDTEDVSIANLKRALISFFQYRNEDATVLEDDVSGKCDVSYVVWHNTAFTKTKLLCKIDTPVHRRQEKPLDVKVNVFSSAEYNLAPDRVTLNTIDSVETYRVTLNAYPNVGVAVNSTFYLEANPAVGTLDKLQCQNIEECIGLLKGVKQTSLASVIEAPKQPKSGLVQTIKDNKKYLANSFFGKSDSAAAVLSMVPVSRHAKTEEWNKALNSRTGKDLRPMLLDVLAATQTTDSFKVVLANIKFNEAADFESAERYLQALAVGTRPEEGVLQELWKMYRDGNYYEKLKDTLLQTIASIGRHYANLQEDNYDGQLMQDLSDYLLNQLSSCKDDDCQIIIVRAMGNFRCPNLIKRLIGVAHFQSNRVAVVALKALKAFPKAYWNTDIIREQLFKIFLQIQKRHDSSTRTLALDILLEQKLTPDEIETLIAYLSSNDPAFEVKQYLIQKLQINAIKCPYYKAAIEAFLKKNPKYNNYHILGQGGLSTAILRQFSDKPSFDGSLLSVQEIKDGVLKRGVADIYIEASGEKFSIFSLGLYSDGLSSFVGGSNDEEGEDVPATAGMELAVQGTTIRPLVFFNGQGELMGHVWSGTASEPTPAYRAVTLLQDHEEVIRLNNGAQINLSVLGAVSIDLVGQVQISLWNRNAVSKVQQNLGFASIIKLGLSSSLVELGLEYELTEDPGLLMDSNIEFSSKIALCIQLTQSTNELKHFIEKKLSVPKTTFKSTSTVTSVQPTSGVSYLLNAKNNEMCSKILS